jgi:hypothetical protein
MDWTHYALKFRLLSPMHIGYRKVGNLMQTRQYVPGKNLWAALTARLTRDHHDGSQGKCYQSIGGLVQQHFLFGYLWPSLDGIEPYFPWKHDDFDYQFLDSYSSAALDYSSNSALEGSLHETEYIAPMARTEKPVYLLGDLWVKASLPKELVDWKREMDNLQLGGERAYGWGRLSCFSDWNNVQHGSGRTIAGHEWVEKSGRIVLTLDDNDKIIAHALASGPDAVANLTGTVEPLVGREWGEFAGQCTPFTGVGFAPGCIVNKKTEFEIKNYGRWNFLEKLTS